MSPQSLLKQYWKHDEFRPLQAEIIDSIISKKNTLAILPTGGGKSVCFQIPGLILDGLCIVISPLIALMKDQVMQLESKGIKAKAIYSGLKYPEYAKIMDDAADNKIKFLYVSPERLKTIDFIERTNYLKIGLLAIDEAHCISKWGYDFRPAYLEINQYRNLIPKVPIIALTATATLKVRKDISEKLNFSNTNVFVKSFSRPNLSYSVLESYDKPTKILQILNKLSGSSIVYARTRKSCMQIADFLKKNNVNADFYHAGLSMIERNTKQEAWISGKTRVIVSTNAFGMGIDKGDVRSVIHFDICENLEAYYQESGRAGRDGLQAYGCMLYNPEDAETVLKNIELKYPPIEELSTIYQKLANYFSIPYGEEMIEPVDFELQHFATTFGLNARLSHYALKALEFQGLIMLNDAYHQSSKIMFLYKSKDFFAFQEKSEKYGEFTKQILRIYGGELFASFVEINEKEIGNFCYLKKEDVVKWLEDLDKLGIIKYSAQKSSPSFMFLNTRQDAERLNIDLPSYLGRKRIETQAAQAMINYAENNGKCRMNMIQNYFDEINTEHCGTCDNCKKLLQNGIKIEVFEKYTDLIEKILPISIENLKSNSDLTNMDDLSKLLKFNIDTELWGIDSYGLLYKK